MIEPSETVLNRMREVAAAHAESGSLMSLADARFIVFSIFYQEVAEWPSPDLLEELASEQLRLTVAAHDAYHASVSSRRSAS